MEGKNYEDGELEEGNKDAEPEEKKLRSRTGGR